MRVLTRLRQESHKAQTRVRQESDKSPTKVWWKSEKKKSDESPTRLKLEFSETRTRLRLESAMTLDLHYLLVTEMNRWAPLCLVSRVRLLLGTVWWLHKHEPDKHLYDVTNRKGSDWCHLGGADSTHPSRVNPIRSKWERRSLTVGT